MTDKHAFAVHLYNTKTLILTLLGIVFSGTALLLGSQHIWTIPNWIQYAFLTVLIAAAFVFSRYLSTRPARVQIGDRTIIIKQSTKPTKSISVNEIVAYAYYEELTLHSLKISLQGNETLSIINFKWDNGTDFQSFLKLFESLVQAQGDRIAAGPVSRSSTFYRSRAKVVITLGLLIAFGATVIFLYSRNAFAYWNPVSLYFFWVLPIAFFMKMWKAK
ncbi:MAG: hypothetical protein JXR84_27060 [Anaerolineae bacterium]|nr:hypothetical protein [Anaerolineae bacterium]